MINDITSFKVYNTKAVEKEIKNKYDRDKIIDLINSENIIKSNIEPVDGIGFGVIVTYKNGDKITVGFTASTMVYSTNEKSTTYKIDKNIVNDLRDY